LSKNIETDLNVYGNIGIGKVADVPLHSIGTQILERESVAAISAKNVLQFTKNGGSSTTPSAIVITLPVGWVNTMIRVEIKGFNYTANTGPWDVVLFGYLRSLSSSWFNQAATITGRAPFSRIRVGYNGTNAVIILGETNTAWSWTRFAVDILSAHQNNYQLAASGLWTAELTDDLSAYSVVAECPIIPAAILPTNRIDGGHAGSVYTAVQRIDGGGA
jgi:hypothetical protein